MLPVVIVVVAVEITVAFWLTVAVAGPRDSRLVDGCEVDGGGDAVPEDERRLIVARLGSSSTDS